MMKVQYDTEFDDEEDGCAEDKLSELIAYGRFVLVFNKTLKREVCGVIVDKDWCFN